MEIAICSHMRFPCPFGGGERLAPTLLTPPDVSSYYDTLVKPLPSLNAVRAFEAA